MPKGAYCSGCGRRVQLTEAGECPQGHPRSMLRDVREGVEPVAEALRASVGPDRSPGPQAPPSHELLSAVIGKGIIIVPVAAIIAFGLWTGYEQGVGTGMSVGGAVLMSVGSLVLTVGAAFVWSAMSRKKKR